MILACILFYVNEACYRPSPCHSEGLANLISSVTTSYMASFIFFFVATVVEQRQSETEARKTVDQSMLNIAEAFVTFVAKLRKETGYKPQIETTDNINFDENDSRHLMSRWVWTRFVAKDRSDRGEQRMNRHNSRAETSELSSTFVYNYLMIEPHIELLSQESRYYLHRVNQIVDRDNWNIQEPSEIWFAYFEEALILYFSYTRSWLLELRNDKSIRSIELLTLLARVKDDRR